MTLWLPRRFDFYVSADACILQAMGMGRDAGAEAAEDGRGAGGGGVLGAGADDEDGVITLLYEEVSYILPDIYNKFSTRFCR